MIDTSATLFHGKTYDEDRDRPRLSSQLERVAEVLKNGKKITSIDLCEAADVSYSALRNRISDLRVYHKFLIEAECIKSGLWVYQFIRLMTDAEHKAYILKLKTDRTSLGDPELWRKSLQTIFALAAKDDIVNLAEMSSALEKWGRNFAFQIREQTQGI